MSEIALLHAIPVLTVDDVAKTVAFFEEHLGFSKAFEFGPYAGVTRAGITIHLNGEPGDCYSRPNSCRIDVTGVDALHTEMEAQGVVKADEKLADTPFGMRQFSVLDPSGNRITFAEMLSQ